MSLDLDPTEQQLAAALGRLAQAYVPEAGEQPAAAQRPDHRRWLALAVAASLIALVAGIWAVAGRDTDPAVVTVPPTPAPLPSVPPTTPAVADTERPLPSSIGIIVPDAAEQLGLEPTAWLQGNPEAFVDDASPPTYAIRRGATPGTLTWQVLPTYWWQSSRLFGNAISLADGRTAVRSDDGATITLSILLDGGVLNATVPAADEPVLRTWLGEIVTDADTTALEPPSGYEIVGATVAGVAVVQVAASGETVAADTPSSTGLTFAITVELDRDASLADVLAVRYVNGAFAPLGDDPSIAYDPELQVLAWQAGPRTFVDLPGTAAERAEALAGGLGVVPSDSPDLVPGVRAFPPNLGQMPAADLTRTVLGATPFGRFAYSELDDGTQRCWRISSLLGGKGDCEGSQATRPICVAGGGTAGPWDAMVILIDRDTADIAVEQDGAAVPTEIATGTTADGTRWLVGSATGIGDGENNFPATITVDGTPCEV